MTGRVVVVGLGPAGPDLVTQETAAVLAEAGDGSTPVWLRTARHPAAVLAPGASTFDDVYERADTFADVYQEITDRLIARAGEHGEVVYAVPGSPRVLERTVDLLARRAAAGEVELDVRPALSFLDLAWVRLGIDPLEEGVRLVDGHRFTTEAAGERGPLLVAHCHNRRVLSDIKLAVDEPPSEPVLIIQRLGSPDEAVTAVDWADLDRSVPPDHLTSLYVPALTAPVAAEVVAFAELVRTLRERCPWDQEQTHVSLSRYALEEAYEVVEAITSWSEVEGGEDLDAAADAEEHLAEELGDLLFQVVFHATLGAERGAFTLADVARGIHDKLVRRHPHVFPGHSAGASPADVFPGHSAGASPADVFPGHSAGASPADVFPGHSAGASPADVFPGHSAGASPADVFPGHSAGASPADVFPGHSAGASPADVFPGHSAGASPADVVAEASVESVDDLLRTWDEMKRAEAGHTSVMDGLTDALPSLLWAHKVLRKAESAGHPWSPEAADPDDLGDQLLLALVAVARARDVDPETALRTAAARVRDQVRAHGD